MLGVDTNVLVRFLANDDDEQTPLAARLLTKRGNQPIHVGVIVLVEAYWVLTRVKKYPAGKVTEAFRMLLLSSQFRIENAETVAAALDDTERVGCGLADALVSILNVAAGCRATATFDNRAQRLAGMVSVEECL